MTIEEAISLIPRGRSLIFTGSGFSYGAKNIRKNPDGSFCDFRGAKQISNDIALKCGLSSKDDGYPLGKISNYYLKTKSADSLISFLKEEFTVSRISQSHKAIGTFPWRRCYTTNYDNVCESAFEQNGIVTASVTMSTDPAAVSLRRNICVHINGAITNLTVNSLDSEVKLTTGSYRKEDLQYSPWFSTFKEDIINADAVFFIGFSGEYDLDILRVLQSTKERKEKFFFINGQDIDPLTLSDMEDIGVVTNLDLDAFLKKCLEQLKDSKNAPIDYTPIKSFREVSFRESSKKTKNVDFVNLITLGRIDRDLLINSVLHNIDGDYFIYRKNIDKIINLLHNGESDFLVTSDLGNGKTMFLEGLAIKLEQNGYAPFFFDKEREFVIDEIDYICTHRDKPIFIFDDYGDKLSVIKKIVEHSETIPVVLAERTAHYQTSLHSIDFIDPQLINIDLLEDSEIKRIVQLFSKNALWEDMANLSDEELSKFVISKCHRQFSNLLLSRFEAKQLSLSYKNLLEAIRQKDRFYNAILFLLTVRYFGIGMEFSEMMESIGGNVLNNSSFRKDPNIRELIDFNNDEISFKSSLLAFYLLKNHINIEDFADFYIKLFNDFDKRIYRNRNAKKVLRSLMPYSQLFRILGKNHPIFTIYENIADCNFTKQNPLFWLQFAIARTADGDFPNAEKCFNTAYACAAVKPGYDTYQIDTHHAHFLLSRAVKTDTPLSDPLELFDKVHTVLKTIRKSDRYRYHIYKVAQDYLPFWKKYKNRFSPYDRVHYKNACKEIAKRAESYLAMAEASSKQIVRRTLADLEEIINS